MYVFLFTALQDHHFSFIANEGGSGIESERSDNDSEGSDNDLEGSGAESPAVGLSTAQIMLLREKRLKSKKAKISDLSSRILEDPQTNVIMWEVHVGVAPSELVHVSL